MANGYRLLTQQEQDDIIVSYMLSQERDAYCHSINLERFNTMLMDLPPGKFKERIEGLRNDTQLRLTEVQATVDATKDQLPPQARIDDALTRIRDKESQAPQIGS